VSDTHRVVVCLLLVTENWSALGGPFLELNDSPVTFYGLHFFNKDGLAIPEH